MREIKFRVWDAEIEEMHDWESLIPSVDMGHLLSNNDGEYDEYRIMLQLLAFYDNKWGFYKHNLSAAPTDETTGK